ncbi:hypothetical protein [Streptomyces radicis]|uniref:IS1 family transposase n=1 Tax=Streptomyces radicis TaxID=1750517 RepID=A0A3A9VQU3_9ACTN|nr:hypothetical protein [Streptomyces radicis]RKN03318.1 hypothetical protein D7319_31830 [Streptomyces radicis]RKN13176.1 hypothetical protein D7318_31645 [Streptomyces radicis]
MSERAAPFYCPYCGDEDLRPNEEGHGAWECAACNRAFRLSFLGLLARGLTRNAPRPADGGTDGDDLDGDGAAEAR